jgi:DNA-binding protein HU-beta
MVENRSARFIESSSAGITYDDSESTGPNLFSRTTVVSAQGKGRGRDWLIGEVAGAAGMSKRQASKAVEAMLGAIAHALKSGNEVRLTGFGTFTVQKKEASVRKSRAMSKVSARGGQPTFIASKELRGSD